jgi:putative glycosyltransferase (TIGR04372 family)
LDKLGVRFLCGESTIGIGSIAYLDHYVKMSILGQRSAARPILLISPELTNPCYVDYWRRYLPDMITNPVATEILWPLAKYLEDRYGAVMDSSGQQIYELYTGDGERAIQAQWEAEGRGHLLTLSDSDHERGWQCLRSLGVPADAWFVGLHVRADDRDITYPRSADINTYRLAMKSIVARGGWVIRMGNQFMPPLPPMPQVIDYAHSAVRSDWMDVFLWARCRFFIGTQSGPHTVPPTFGVPCVITNWSSLRIRPWFNKDLCIFRLSWSEREARYLNFEEVISSALAWAECTGYRASQGIKLVDNTPEEINDVVVEMLERLEGKLQYSKKDDELQERFDSLYTSNASKANARIGRDFLRKWAHLL